MRGVSTSVGAYLALLAIAAVGIALASALERVGAGLVSSASAAASRLEQVMNPPVMRLLYSGGGLYLLVEPYRPFRASFLFLEFSNGTIAFYDLGGIVVSAPSKFLVMQRYSGEVFRPGLVTSDGAVFVYSPARDPGLLTAWGNAVAGKAYVDPEVVGLLAYGTGAYQQPSIYDPITMSRVKVATGDTPFVDPLPANISIDFVARLYFAGGDCPTLSVYYKGRAISLNLFCASNATPGYFFEPSTVLDTVYLGQVAVDVVMKVVGVYRGYVYFWYPQPQYGTKVPVAPFFLVLEFAPRGSYLIAAEGRASLRATFPGDFGLLAYFPSAQVCTSVMHDYFGPMAFAPLVLAPVSAFGTWGWFNATLNQVGIYGGFNQTSRYDFTNGTLLGPASPSSPGVYPPLGAAWANGTFATDSYLILLAGNTYFSALSPYPSRGVELAASVSVERVKYASPPAASMSVPSSGYFVLERPVLYQFPPAPPRQWSIPAVVAVSQYKEPKAVIAVPLGSGNASIRLSANSSTAFFAPLGALALSNAASALPVETWWKLDCSGEAIALTKGSILAYSWTASAVRASPPLLSDLLWARVYDGSASYSFLVEARRPSIKVSQGFANQSTVVFLYRGSEATFYNERNESVELDFYRGVLDGRRLVVPAQEPVFSALLGPGPNALKIPESFEPGIYVAQARPIGTVGLLDVEEIIVVII